MLLKLTEDMSIAHEVEAKYASAVVRIFPSPIKGGMTAGGAVRTVLELAGVKNVGAKILSRSKNKLNNAKATLEALETLSNPKNPMKEEKKEKKPEARNSKPASVKTTAGKSETNKKSETTNSKTKDVPDKVTDDGK